MKADDSRSPSLPRHELEHAIPTVIHHPEEDKPLLARWIEHAMENPTRFWGLITALVVVVTGLSLVGGGLTLGKAASDEAWSKLELAKTPGERVEIAKEFPKTPAERWALLQAATEYFNKGFEALPANRDVALPNLKLALDTFQKVANEAPKDSPQARAAALGVARTYEARGELDKAVAQYEKVARTREWAGTEEARAAETYAHTLRTPEAVAFYKDLASYKPVEATLPAGGIGNLKFPFGPATGASPVPGATILPIPSTTDEPNPLAVPPPPSPAAAGTSGGMTIDLQNPAAGTGKDTGKAKTQDQGTDAGAKLPSDVFTPKPSSEPGATKPPAGTIPEIPLNKTSGPKAEVDTPRASDLPADVFTPKAPASGAGAEGSGKAQAPK